ncbi:MAG TPA: hypothetical protein VE053_07235 [Allosphingosinicella sp.]|nr:hypothetical protein [Allosphingosinicella sp.]
MKSTIGRRAVLRGAAGLAIAGVAARGLRAAENSPGGKPGDFDFLTGEWRIANRMIKPGTTDEWIEFMGEATCWSILAGVGSVEELRIPARNFSGMGLRLLDVDKRIWSDHWVNSKSGVMTVPGQTGLFRGGVGTFGADDMDGDVPVKVRSVWDRITPNSCRWYQGLSRDGGRTWRDTWFMSWKRA